MTCGCSAAGKPQVSRNAAGKPQTAGEFDRIALWLIRRARPAPDGVYIWLGLRWLGMPWPLRVLAAELSDRFDGQRWPGCGCLVTAKRIVENIFACFCR